MNRKTRNTMLAALLLVSLLTGGCGGTVSPSPSPFPTISPGVTSPSPEPVSPSPDLATPSPETTPGGADTDAAAEKMNAVYTAIHPLLKENIQATGDYAESEFADLKLPTHTVEKLKRGDKDYGALLDVFGFDAAHVDAYLLITALMSVNADYILVLHATDKEAARASLDKLHTGQDELWSSYLPDQYEKVQNNVTGEEGDYLYYVTFDDAARDDIVDAIRNTLRE